ncbi:RNA-directed DNA polymerase, eukaryota, reverse transcriptase zinc-binding domain protein [Tanacetum coccineum]
MARMAERLNQFVDQLADRMNDMMNPRRRGDRNGRRSEGEESRNPFFEGDSSSSAEQPDRPRTLFVEPIIWDIGDEKEEYPFVENFQNFQEEKNNVSFTGVVLGVEEESLPVYDTDIEDVIEEEEGFVGKGGFGGEEDNIEDVVVVANDLCFSMIQTTLSVDFSKIIDSNPHKLIWLQKGNLVEVSNTETLINSLNNVWIGKLKMHANVARFERKIDSQTRPKVSPQVVDSNRTASFTNKVNSYANVAKNPCCGNASNYDHKDSGISRPTITLSHDISKDFPMALLAMCRNEGFMEVEFKYLGGLWVLFEFPSKEAKEKFLNHNGIKSWFSTLKPWYDEFVVDERLIWLEIESVPIRTWCNDAFTNLCRKWGEVFFLDDSDPCNRLSKRLCVKSSHALLVFESTLVTLNNVTYAIRVRELCSWMPNFICNDSKSDDDANSVGHHEQHRHGKADTAQEPASSRPNVHDDLKESHIDSDPFGLGPLINKTAKKATSLSHSNTPDHPPGFYPFKNVQYASDSTYNFSGGDPSKNSGFSLLERLEETIKVGLALGLNMEGVLCCVGCRRRIEESMPVYDTNIEDVIEEEEGFVGKEGFGEEKDNIEDVVVVANDLCFSMIQTTLSVDFSKTVDSNPHELIWLQKGGSVYYQRSGLKVCKITDELTEDCLIRRFNRQQVESYQRITDAGSLAEGLQ